MASLLKNCVVYQNGMQAKIQIRKKQYTKFFSYSRYGFDGCLERARKWLTSIRKKHGVKNPTKSTDTIGVTRTSFVDSRSGTEKRYGVYNVLMADSNTILKIHMGNEDKITEQKEKQAYSLAKKCRTISIMARIAGKSVSKKYFAGWYVKKLYIKSVDTLYEEAVVD